MECPKCKLVEMYVDKVANETFYFKCPKCGGTEEVKEEELEKQGD